MDPQIVNGLKKEIYARFPEVSGCVPKIRKNDKVQGKNIVGKPSYLLTFQGSASNPQGKVIPRHVRVVADENGKILKISTSR